MKEVDFSNKLANAVAGQKKISRDGKTDVQEILNFIEWVNSQDQETVCLPNGRSFSDVIILDEFKDLIYPASVRYEANSRIWAQLLVRKPCEFVPDYSKYLNACAAFRGLFKKDLSNGYVTLESLRVISNLSDVMDKASFSGKVHYVDKPFYPIPLAPSLTSLFDNDIYLNSADDVVIGDWISELRF